MKLGITGEQIEGLRAFLERYEDAERLSEREYVVDLYEIERPVSLDIVFEKGRVMIEGAAELKYDEEMEGWYMGERLRSEEAIRKALEQAGAWRR